MPAFRVRLCFGRFYCVLAALLLSTLFIEVVPAVAQSELATVFGRVTDPSGAVISGAEVEVRNVDTGISVTSATNVDGLYTVPSLHPGHYVISVRKPGFRSVSATGLELNVQDNVARNFSLQVGSAAESVTVTAEEANINTTDGTVSTMIDRNFAENLPMNGRSFQSLIQLTPGVVLVPSGTVDSGQFSVNGQRAASNYWMVDGVSANIGIGAAASNPGNGLTGTLGSFSAMGGTNSLVSVDAMQEFRIQTSTYAPEFGRAPGAQISVITRSGTNQFHGTAFDYFRNDVLDANNWFNGYTNSPPLPKPKERQNDFGGTFSGPIVSDKTFFFLSYEGLRLRLPQTTLSTVPDLVARQSAPPGIQPYLNAFPLSNGSDDAATGIAQFNASYSNPASLDAYSLRLDHHVNGRLAIFGRYDYSPSEIAQRGATVDALSVVNTARVVTETATIGTSFLQTPTLSNDLRVNYSRTSAFAHNNMDSFGGAIPLESLPIPDPFTSENALFAYRILSLQHGLFSVGQLQRNTQRQVNVIDSQSVQEGSHSLKFGGDFRRLSPIFAPESYSQSAIFADVPSAQSGSLRQSTIATNLAPTFLFRNLGLYAQDTWHVVRRLTLTYGLRWDVDFAPTTTSGPSILAVTGFNLNDFSNLALAPKGMRPYSTTFGNLAPRVGAAYQLIDTPEWPTVIRGGIGTFYDLATSEMGNTFFAGSYPFGAAASAASSTFPLPPSATTPPPITPPGPSSGELTAFDPGLRLPYTLEWNVALEQGLGKQQTVSASYIGSAGRRLLQTLQAFAPNPNYEFASIVVNRAMSDYDALQLQFQRRLAHDLQALASYTWSHSIDTASAGSFANISNLLAAGLDPNQNRGPSDFDIRHAFSVGITYDIPAPKTFELTQLILKGWSVESLLQGRSAPPVDASDFNFFQLNSGVILDVRPDRLVGQPAYLFGSQYPGGKAFNPSAFTDPPGDPNTGVPDRQGNLGRNALRGFGALQCDFAVHRTFEIRERIKLQFRAEIFNLFNHPNFGQPDANFGLGGFGLSTQMLAQSLNAGNLGGGAFNPLYQIGNPRSVQLAMKLIF